MIYFIKCEGFVKIGYSDNINKRLAKFRCENPFELTLINQMVGDRSIELDLHYYFKDYHHRGDWFFIRDDMYTIKKVPTFHSNEKKIKIFLRHEQASEALKNYMDSKVFIHEGLFSRYAWERFDKKEINKFNKELTGVSNFKTFLNVLKVKDILLQKHKNYKLVELTGLNIPTIMNYRNLIQKNLTFWQNL